jgi:hypothetical protein
LKSALFDNEESDFEEKKLSMTSLMEGLQQSDGKSLLL